MIFKNMNSTAEKVAKIAEPLAKEAGLQIWNVTFEKEGSLWYLRVFLDKLEGSISLDDCEQFSRKLSQLLDEKDLIEHSYLLEVSSPGVERELTKSWHFEKYTGQLVSVKIAHPPQSTLTQVGTLISATKDELTLKVDDKIQIIEAKNINKVKLYFDFAF